MQSIKANQKTIVIIVTIAIILALGAGFWVWKEKKISQPKQTTQTTKQLSKTEEIESISNLIDGEYTFIPIDTSDWQTYRNEEIGFEVKIPKNWEMREIQKEENKGAYLWFSQKGRWYEFEGGKENAIIISVFLKTNPFFRFSETTLKTWKNGYNISIKNTTINGVLLYYYTGFGEGVMTTKSFSKNYSFSLSSGLILKEYTDVWRVLHGMIQSVNFF
jgi:uncharacterized protein YxeA